MLVSYPALFYYDDSESVKYFICFPDIDSSGTQGVDISDAMVNAADYLGIMVAHYIEDGLEVPTPSLISELSLEANNPFKDDKDFELDYDVSKSFISMVCVDLSEYLGSQEPVKKTLTIPKWADNLGRELHLNFSKTLTDAIAEKRFYEDEKSGLY